MGKKKLKTLDELHAIKLAALKSDGIKVNEIKFLASVGAPGEYVLTRPLRVIDPGMILRLHLALLEAEAKRCPEEAKLDELARDQVHRVYEKDGSIEIDEDAPTRSGAHSGSSGRYVQAWLWADGQCPKCEDTNVTDCADSDTFDDTTCGKHWHCNECGHTWPKEA